ncbi:alpha/beta hydrolase [Pseudonocardia ailaonensis]|uniref:Alpha/beta hydrolase n=1 Tax=Pseudonocardia ailaonensis TaxID=367279 RepID=A0ABN2MZ27_9PSEU
MIPTNGLRLHAAHEGEGELVVLIHGFPQSWYVWRNQVRPLVEAGYRVVAPDQRGYGLSDRPPGVEDYDIRKVSADIVGLADHLGAEKFTVVGQDWGCITAWHVALLYPHRVRGVLGFSVPYVPKMLRNWAEPAMHADSFWYARYFLQPGVAEAEFDADLTNSLMWMWYAASSNDSGKDMAEIISGGPKDRTLFDGLGPAPTSIPGHSQADIDYCLSLYRESGMRGPLNYYRNMPRIRELTPWLEEARILVPAMFAYGSDEPVTRRTAEFDTTLSKAPLDQQEEYFAQLLDKVCIPDAGHWPMVEQPDAVTKLVLGFLGEVAPAT